MFTRRCSVRLPQDVVEILSSYGKLSFVVNTILDAWEYGDLLPCEIPRQGDSRYSIDICSSTYEANRQMYGATSNRCSIRGILCRVVYYMLDWLDVLMGNKQKQSIEEKYIALLQGISNKLDVAYNVYNDNALLQAKELINGAIKSCKN